MPQPSDAVFSYDRSIIDILFDHAERIPDHPALIYDLGDGPIDQFDYRGLADAVRQMAGALTTQGLAGRHVALLFAPGAEFVIAMLATLATGGVAVPVAPVGRRRERINNLLLMLGNCDPAALIVDAQSAAQYGDELPEALALQSIDLLHYDALRSEGGEAQIMALDADRLAVLQFTSGSTSTPKGVMVTHGNIIGNQWMIQRAFGHDATSDFVGWAPHFHDQGLFGNIIQPLYLGATCVLSAPSAFIQRPMMWLELIDRYRANTSGGPNFAFDLCIEAAKRRGLPDVDLSCWKVAFNGAERVRPGTLRAFTEMFAPIGFQPETFLPCYGLAECTLVTIATPHDRAPVSHAYDAEQLVAGQATPAIDGQDSLTLASCGPAMVGGEVAIVDPETMAECDEHEVGEIWLRGPHVAMGYWLHPEATEATFGAMMADGRGPWLRTGDLGFCDGGEYAIYERMKDLIILRGRNYAPADVEQLWSDISGNVGQVAAAAVQLTIEGMDHVALVAEMPRTALSKMDDDALQTLAFEFRAAAMERLELGVTDLVLVHKSAIPRTTSGKPQRAKTAKMLEAGELPGARIAGPLGARLISA